MTSNFAKNINKIDDKRRIPMVFLIKNEPPTICEKKGVLILEFQLDHKKEDGGYEVEDEI